MTKKDHTSRAWRVTVIVIVSGIGAGGYRGFGEGNTSRISSEYTMTRGGYRTFWGGNASSISLGCGMLSDRRRRRIREVCRTSSPSREPCCRIPAGTGGTGGEISARMHAANSLGDRAKEGHRSARRHSANSLWERVESCVSSVASIVVADARIGSDWGERSACTHASHSSWERVEPFAN